MYATTLLGLEDILKDELLALGAENVLVQKRLVSFYGETKLLYKANLWCRTAIRILKPISEFTSYSEKDFYASLQKISWSDYVDETGSIAIDAIVNNSHFTHSLYVAQLTKDAIVDQFRQNSGVRPSVDLKSPDLRISIYIYKNKVEVSLDASGTSLHKRGYRTQTHTVPINEVLAAGIILSTSWDKKSPFVDGMCGTGTFLIEAAMIAFKIAPGYYRKNFGFMNWPDYDKVMHHNLRQEMENQKDIKTDVSIMGCDVNKKTSQIARDNIFNAGLNRAIKVANKSFEQFSPDSDVSGVLVMNPPYGARQSIQSDIDEKYKMMGDAMKNNYTGYDAYIFTGNLTAAKKIGLRCSRRTPLHNGAIDCRLLHFEMYKGSKK